MVRVNLLRRLEIGEWFLCRYLPDDRYLSMMYRINMGRPLNLANPRTFTEKIQWLKLHWRQDLLTQCADKYEARKFVHERIGPDILKKVYGVYEKTEDIDIAKLPDTFVLKVNHGCKQNIFCKKKSHLDWTSSLHLINRYLKTNLYYPHREWAYKNIVPRILCEEYLMQDGGALYEYGFYCFSGVPRFVEINEYNGGDQRVGMFDLHFNLLENRYGNAPLPASFPRPSSFDRMLEYASGLAESFPFVRVDLIFINHRIYFGEMTFYPLAGLCKLSPDWFDYFLGSYLDISAERLSSFEKGTRGRSDA